MVAAGIPIVRINVANGTPVATYSRALTGPETTTANGIIANAIYQVRRPRTLLAIYNDLQALSTTQKNNVWTALIAGTPQLWATDTGPNAAALAAIQWGGTVASGIPAASITEAKIRGAMMYVQDNPRWLEHPTFDPTINISGDEVVS